MARATLKPSARRRIVTVILVAGLHFLVGLALIRAFAPDLVKTVIGATVATVDISLPPAPEPPPPQDHITNKMAPAPKGEAAAPGRKAVASAISAPMPPVILTPQRAPPVAGKGVDPASGEKNDGEGTGAQGQGVGTGAGEQGQGAGGGGRRSPPVKIAGDINSARDYAKAGRALRINTRVIIALTVGTDGRVQACRVVQASADPEAGPVTCQLATQRFRFRPATDAAGNTVEAIYGWQQRWFY